MSEDRKDAAPREPIVALKKRVFDFFLRELEDIHDLMDLADIAREVDGKVLSVSQRVMAYVTANEETFGAIKKARGNPPH